MTWTIRPTSLEGPGGLRVVLQRYRFAAGADQPAGGYGPAPFAPDPARRRRALVPLEKGTVIRITAWGGGDGCRLRIRALTDHGWRRLVGDGAVALVQAGHTAAGTLTCCGLVLLFGGSARASVSIGVVTPEEWTKLTGRSAPALHADNTYCGWLLG